MAAGAPADTPFDFAAAFIDHGVARQVSAIRLQRVRQLLGLPAAAPGPARPAQVRLAVY